MILLPSAASGALFRAEIADRRRWIAETEADIRGGDRAPIYCNICDRPQIAMVDGGPDFGPGYPNLREGLVCPCGAKNRDRLMVLASRDRLLTSTRTYFFGAMSGWADWARRLRPETTIFCEYLADHSSRGREVTLEPSGLVVRNEDLTRTGFEDASADLVVHQDVLEHIPDFRAALRETHRILRPGGATIFTAPFFDILDEGWVRARVTEDGRIEHLMAEERHGDPLSPEGILAFYNFGWDLLTAIREEGFQDVGATMVYAPDLGLVSNGCPVPEGNMLPIYISATKPS